MTVRERKDLLTLDNLFRCAARVYADRPAVVAGDAKYSYGEYEEMVSLPLKSWQAQSEN